MTTPLKDDEVTDGNGDYVSDDSSFYGSPSQRASLEEKSRNFSSVPNAPSLTAIAISNVAAAPSASQPTPALYNPYRNLLLARQLSESVASFLERLPPATTICTDGPWIYIANPHSTHRPTSCDLASLKLQAEPLLNTFLSSKTTLEGSRGQQIKSPLAPRKIAALRRTMETDILTIARNTGCMTGKWMLFPLPENVNDVWRVVAEGTAQGELGIAAKVATDAGDGDRVGRLICVYTVDYGEKEDVKRVLKALIEKGLVSKQGKGIYYKCDAYTHLGVFSKNEWGLRASLYSSKEVLGWPD